MSTLPSADELHRRILNRDADRGLTGPASSGGPGTASPGPVPAAERADLVGRDDAVAPVGDLLRSVALVTLTRPGGTGKTSLAEQVAAPAQESYPDGVVVSHLASARDPDGVGPALVEPLRTQLAGERPIVNALVDALGTRRFLLLLDNCEHVLRTVTDPDRRARQAMSSPARFSDIGCNRAEQL